MACLSLSPLVHRANEGLQWRAGCAKKRQAEPEGDAPRGAKRVCMLDVPSSRDTAANRPSEARLLSSEGRIVLVPPHVLAHMPGLANEERRALVDDGHEVLQTGMCAALLEHVISSLQAGAVEPRESVADNVELLCASEALSLSASHVRPLLRSLAHQVWELAHNAGVSQLSLLGQLRVSPHAKEQIALILTACSR
jgi:hypothetical protein